MTILWERNGTISSWTSKSRIDVLFPEQHINISGTTKLRGGMPICCPLFGTMPQSAHYKGLTIPQHGYVRLGKYSAERIEHVGTSGRSFNFLFEDHLPWRHEVGIVSTLSTMGRADTLHQYLQVKRFDNCTDERPMPVSMGLHPYFATLGESYVIGSGNHRIPSEQIEHNNPLFLPRAKNGLLTLSFGRRLILIDLSSGGYTGFCIWTDSVDYICVEPILGKPDDSYALLNPGEVIECVCSITHRII